MNGVVSLQAVPMLAIEPPPMFEMPGQPDALIVGCVIEREIAATATNPQGLATNEVVLIGLVIAALHHEAGEGMLIEAAVVAANDIAAAAAIVVVRVVRVVVV